MVKVLLYTYFPFYSTHLGGGLQNGMRSLVSALNKYADIQIEVVCPYSNLHPFADDVKVFPVIEDMEVNGRTPTSLWNDLQKIQELERNADLIWVVDRCFPVHTEKPILFSMFTVCYERELKAFFNSNWTKMVVVSNFLKEQLVHCCNKPEKIELIPPYIDDIFYRRSFNTVAECMNRYFPYDETKKYILFPHRPEEEKGVIDAIGVLSRLLKHTDKYRLLVPLPPDSKVADLKKESDFITKIRNYVRDLDLLDYVIFHPWIEYRDMPFYYSIGEATLFLSKLPETFGYSLVHSVCCGTHVISYGKGALKEAIPPGNGHFVVEEGNLESITQYIENRSKPDIACDIQWAKEKYKVTIEKYAELLLTMK